MVNLIKIVDGKYGISATHKTKVDNNMKVELLRAWQDKTWDTVVVEITDFPSGLPVTTDDIVMWADSHLLIMPEYRDVVVLAVYKVLEDESNDAYHGLDKQETAALGRNNHE